MKGALVKFTAFGLLAGMLFLSIGCDNPNNPAQSTGTEPAHTHEWGEWISTNNYIEAGTETRICLYDSSHTQTRSCAQRLITNTAEWKTALSHLNGRTGSYTISISGDIGVAGYNTFGETSSGSLNVTLVGSGKLYLTSQGYMLYIGERQRLIIDSANLTLQGLTSGQNGSTQNNTNYPVIWVYENGTFELIKGTITGNTLPNAGSGAGVGVRNGSFIMRGGEITGNKGSGVAISNNGIFTMYGGEITANTFNSDYTSGHGVTLNNGTFAMHGGKISRNSTGTSGGGVSVSTNGHFTMYDGEISENNATGSSLGLSGRGGGVYIANNGTFSMYGGVIYGNNAVNGGGLWNGGTFRMLTGTIHGINASPMNLRNTATNGAVLYNEGVAQRGYPSGNIWVSLGDLTTTNSTLRTVNGVLQ